MEKWVQIIAAIMIGLVLPACIIRLTVPTTESKQTETHEQSEEFEQTPAGIWVLQKDGENQWMLLEEYLTGVILAEMPTTYDHDALCAQAVAARTYALKRKEGQRHPQGAVCTEPACCQAYVDISEFLNGLGYEQDVIIAKKAVLDTAGMVIKYDNKLIEATYFHSSGGYTEEAVAVWGVDLPYLQTVKSPGEESLEDFSQRIFYSKAELENMLERTLPGKPSSWLGWTTYTMGGGVESMLFAGVQYSGIELRGKLKLNSTAFRMEPEGDGLWITVLGKGHRVGMSQTGAQAMALQGSTWREILAHYYPGTRIDKMEDVG